MYPYISICTYIDDACSRRDEAPHLRGGDAFRLKWFLNDWPPSSSPKIVANRNIFLFCACDDSRCIPSPWDVLHPAAVLIFSQKICFWDTGLKLPNLGVVVEKKWLTSIVARCQDPHKKKYALTFFAASLAHRPRKSQNIIRTE